MAKKKKSKSLISVYKDGKRYVIAYTLPDGSKIAFESRFKNK